MERFGLSKWYVFGLSAVAGVGLIIVVVMLLGQKNPIPGPIKAKVSSIILAPSGSSASVDRESVKFDSSLKLLSFNTTIGSITAVISQQPTPEAFTDIPQVYDKVVSNMNEFSKFESDLGTVHLTRPKDLGGKQAAVLNTKGTLMFVKPALDLTDEQWRKFFNNLQVIR